MRVNPNYSADMINLMDQAQQAEDNAAQELSTGRRVNLPSDNPAAEASMIGENSRSAAVDQYTANSDSLTDVLQLNRVQIADLYANLLYQTDRHMPRGDEEDIDADTVLDLLLLVEKATPRSSNEQPFIPPAPRRKGLSRLTGIFIPPARLQAVRAATPPKPSSSKIKAKP